MKTEQNILLAFLLNLAFSVFEFIGGTVTGSIAIMSDAVHDLGDAVSIGVSYFLEKKSKQQPDEQYTYGYARYSVIGSVITTMVLLAGSCMVIYHAVERLIFPVDIHYSGMIIFAIIGVMVNVSAAFLTHGAGSLNQKAVNLHMIEDVLGWIVVLLGAVIMRLTDIKIIDPVMSLGVAVFILINAIKNLKAVLGLFLVKIPNGISVEAIKERILKIDGVCDVHHVHIWSMDTQSNYATMHVVTNSDAHRIKETIREELKKYGIVHVTLELEAEGEHCHEASCHIGINVSQVHCHHHHHE